jgi:hypothetical protein
MLARQVAERRREQAEARRREPRSQRRKRLLAATCWWDGAGSSARSRHVDGVERMLDGL